jgi:hypothetical protein
MVKTNTPQLKFVNAETGEEIVRDATTEEIAEIKLNADNAATKELEAEAKKAARQALLDKLGITAEEAQLLLG